MSVAAYLERAAHLAAAADAGVPVQHLFDCAMAGDDGALLLRYGDGAEACRLLRLVRWERVPLNSLRRWLQALADVAWLREQGSKAADGAERFVRSNLAEHGLLAEQQEGKAA